MQHMDPMSHKLRSLIPAWVQGRLQPLDKLEVHRLGLRHPAISVFVTDGPRILLQRRALTKYHTPGLWTNTCCTHPHWNEPLADCARRRLQEELGIDGLDLRDMGEIEYRADVGQGLTEHELVRVYRAEGGPDLAMSPDPEEVAETAWMDLDALEDRIARNPADFTPWLRIYLREHRTMIFGP